MVGSTALPWQFWLSTFSCTSGFGYFVCISFGLRIYSLLTESLVFVDLLFRVFGLEIRAPSFLRHLTPRRDQPAERSCALLRRLLRSTRRGGAPQPAGRL